MNIERLTYMANQIARNFAAQGEDKAARLTAEHIRDYWTPAMRQTLASADPAALCAIAGAAVRQLS